MALMIKLFFHSHPPSVQLVHGFIELVFIEVFAGLVQATGGGQKGSTGMINQSEFGTGKKDTAENHGLEKPPVADRLNRAKQPVQLERVPTVAQDGQSAETPGLG